LVDKEEVFIERDGRFHLISIPVNLLFLNPEKEEDRFSIDENFEEINVKSEDFKLNNLIYKRDGKISFLDEVTAADFGGEFSPVFAKSVCGNGVEREKIIKNIESESFGFLDYLEVKVYYSNQEQSIAELIMYLSKLQKTRSDSLAIKLFDKWEREWTRHTNDYYVEQGYDNPEGCLKLRVTSGNLEFSYGDVELTFVGNKLGDAEITLVDGSSINVELFDSNALGCQGFK